MLATRQPGHRLITQNLLISAVTFEREKQVFISSLQDLSILIDLFCLYDHAVVISRNSLMLFHEMKSELMGLLDEHSFVEINEPKDTEAVALTARKHLATFLGVKDVERYDGLLRYALSPSEAGYGIHDRADGVEEIQLGQEWLYTAPNRASLLRQLGREEDVARGTTFLVRTFLYLAYADVAKLTFTPDAVRCPVLDNILRDEDEFFHQALMSKFQSAWEHYPTSGYQGLRRTVSPFAAIVFERAKSRSEIVSQMEMLRKELAPLRERIHKLEEKALWGSRDEAVDAERKWEQVLTEIETNFGPDPHLVSIKRAITFGESIGEIMDKPTSWKNWLSSLTNLPLEIATRLVSQRPAIEIHRLRPKLPSPGRLAKSVERLFGPI
jgi:hypothetical protein